VAVALILPKVTGLAACAANATATMASVDVAIVGAGLSGLVVASGLAGGKGGETRSWMLLEAHASRLGGRIRNSEEGDIDLGPAWMWPAHQPKMRALAQELGVETFAQPDDSSSTRLVGGSYSLIQALQKRLPADNIKMGFQVKKCELVDGMVLLTSADGVTVSASRAVFAAPPKILSTHVKFSPSLSPSRTRAMAESQTWMAGVTKVALHYPARFWPLQGGVSNTGLRPGANRPAFQVYDAGDARGDVSALTFFTIAHEDWSDADLARACAFQLGELWTRMGLGDKSAQLTSFTKVIAQRWPKEPWISDDPSPGTVHPHPQPVRALAESDWQGKLLFASSEADQDSPGVMEGAVGAAHRVLQTLSRGDSNQPRF
jgi:monoamine oxidase